MEKARERVLHAAIHIIRKCGEKRVLRYCRAPVKGCWKGRRYHRLPLQSGTGKRGGKGLWEMLHDKAFCTFGISYLGVRLTIHKISLILKLF